MSKASKKKNKKVVKQEVILDDETCQKIALECEQKAKEIVAFYMKNVPLIIEKFMPYENNSKDKLDSDK